MDAIYDYEAYSPLFVRKWPERVYESKFTEDLNELKAQLVLKFGLKEWQMGVSDFCDTGSPQASIKYQHPSALELIIPDFCNNLTIIDKFMDLRGYKMTYRKVDNYPNVPATLVHLIYIPKDLKGIRNDIAKCGDVLYHVTPTKNIDSILKKGLFPKERKGLFNIYYEPRVYFLRGDADIKEVENYTKETLALETGESDYTLITVDINKVPDYVEFYYDPLIGRNSIFTTYAISPDAFDSVRKSFIVIEK